jgi:hypothetical protein
MDKLTTTSLILLFLSKGTGFTCLGLLLMMLLGIAETNHKTLFCISVLVTNYFYGIIGVFYATLYSLMIFSCSVMYLFNVSVSDMKGKMLEFRNSTLKDEGNEPGLMTSFEINVTKIPEYKRHYSNIFFEKTNLTEERLNYLKSYYTYISYIFDKLCDVVYFLICKIRSNTENVVILKNIYYIYDQMYHCSNKMDVFRAVCTDMRNSNNTKNTELINYSNNNTKVFDKGDKNRNSENNNKSTAGAFSGFNENDMQVMQEEIQKQYNNMTPQQRKEEADKAMIMFKKLCDSTNFDAMMNSMINDFSSLQPGLNN